MAFDYTELTPDEQVAQLRARIHDLEAQHLQAQIRIDSPTLAQPASDQDKDLVKQLEASIASLRKQLPAPAKSE